MFRRMGKQPSPGQIVIICVICHDGRTTHNLINKTPPPAKVGPTNTSSLLVCAHACVCVLSVQQAHICTRPDKNDMGVCVLARVRVL